KQQLEGRTREGDLVYFFWAPFHFPRDVLQPSWVIPVSRLQTRKNVFAPRVSPGNSGELLFYSSAWQLPELPFRDYLATSLLLEEFSFWLTSSRDNFDALSLEASLLRMVVGLASSLKIDVVLWSLENQRSLASLAGVNQDLEFVSCYDERLEVKEYQLSYDSHPNEKGAQIVARCLSNWLFASR
ncbi:MAG: hypothetical protein KDD55_05245, partial [Bdellovibrionales bacterium]|nr:hypothetical protein [Bdellovibrionales bacterium]